MTLSQHARHRHSEIDREKMVPFSLVKIYVFQHFFRVFFNYITQLRLREDLFVLEEMVRSAVHVHVSGEVGCAAGKGHNSN
jgi:hypothetical protein